MKSLTFQISTIHSQKKIKIKIKLDFPPPPGFLGSVLVYQGAVYVAALIN